MKTQLIQSLTPSISTFLIGLNSYKNRIPPKNAIFNNFMSRVDVHTRSGKLYHAYKVFVKDCCALAEKSNRRAFEVADEVMISIE